jgi:nicotinamide riboside kinase
MKKTTIVNLIGGPGVGKSTIVSGVFSILKMHRVDCEYVPEYAKELQWEYGNISNADQIKIFGEQYHRLWILKDKVDFIITDSPIILSLYYAKHLGSSPFNKMIYDFFHSFDNINFYLERNIPYDNNGRWQNENEAKQIDPELKEILNSNDIKYMRVNSDYSCINTICNHILVKLQIPQIYYIYKSA